MASTVELPTKDWQLILCENSLDRERYCHLFSHNQLICLCVHLHRPTPTFPKCYSSCTYSIVLSYPSLMPLYTCLWWRDFIKEESFRRG